MSKDAIRLYCDIITKQAASRDIVYEDEVMHE